MADDLALIGTGIRFAGALHLVLLAGYVVATRQSARLAAIPLLYAVTLAAALLRPAVVSQGVGIAETTVWTLGLALSATTYLLVLQLVDRGLPDARHFYVLLVPLVALPLVHLAGYFGHETVCFGNTGACAPVAEAVMLYDVLAGAPILLLLLGLRHRALRSLHDAGDRARFALAMTIIGLQALILALTLLKLSQVLPNTRVDTAAAVLQVAMVYLVGTALFRLDTNASARRADGTDTDTATAATASAAASADAAQQPDVLLDSERALLERIETLMQLDKLYQQQGFSRRQLADELEAAEHHVSRAINVGRGQSFTEMINAYRVSEAADLLSKTEESVTEIAFAVGFNSLATFNRVFKQRMGASPSEYRKSHRAIPENAA